MSTASAPYESILETIGATPVVRLSRILEPGSAAVHLKLEQLNPCGSMKDRTARAILEQAEAQGRLKPGGTVVEATSGNFGIGLALVCAVKGYKLVLAMPESMSLERRALLRSYGVRLELTPAQLHLEGAMARARALAAEIPDAFVPSQFENEANARAHEDSTAQELLASAEADGVRIDAFVMGFGSGGALTGIGRALRARIPEIQILAVEPAGSEVLSGKPAGPHRIQGLGPGFVPPLLDRSLVDRSLAVSDRDAWAMKDRLAKEEGLLVGLSTGAHVHAAAQVARELGPGHAVYTLACDTGERYFSMAEHFR
ncbi:MAG TPA: cysteine synthase A [Myxococcaceae bacterium]|nr:cysteine synthase A [Myxococcaceae bacterium]